MIGCAINEASEATGWTGEWAGRTGLGTGRLRKHCL